MSDCVAHRITAMTPATPGYSILEWTDYELDPDDDSLVLRDVTLWLAMEHDMSRNGQEWTTITVEAWAAKDGWRIDEETGYSCQNWGPRDGNHVAFGLTADMQEKAAWVRREAAARRAKLQSGTE